MAVPWGHKGARNRVDSVRTRGAGLVDERLPTPLYHQIYLILRDKILSTDYEVDTVLPSEQETARRFGVSRITARRALDELAAAGLVVRERATDDESHYAFLTDAQPIPGGTDVGEVPGMHHRLVLRQSREAEGRDLPEATRLDHVAFEIPAADYEPWKQRLVDAGAEIALETTFPNMRARALFVCDPEGNSIEFICHDEDR